MVLEYVQWVGYGGSRYPKQMVYCYPSEVPFPRSRDLGGEPRPAVRLIWRSLLKLQGPAVASPVRSWLGRVERSSGRVLLHPPRSRALQLEMVR